MGPPGLNVVTAARWFADSLSGVDVGPGPGVSCLSRDWSLCLAPSSGWAGTSRLSFGRIAQADMPWLSVRQVRSGRQPPDISRMSSKGLRCHGDLRSLCARRASCPAPWRTRQVQLQQNQDIVLDLETARLDGVVLDTRDRLPLGNVELTLSSLDGGGEGVVDRRAVSSAGGAFSFAEVAGGSWKLTANRPGYSPKEQVLSLGSTQQRLEVLLDPAPGLAQVVPPRAGRTGRLPRGGSGRKLPASWWMRPCSCRSFPCSRWNLPRSHRTLPSSHRTLPCSCRMLPC
jgi:hypothetical protein